MNTPTFNYDIRTSINAQETLVALTDIPISSWEGYRSSLKEYIESGKSSFVDSEAFIKHILKLNNVKSKNHLDFFFTFIHITTNSNYCSSIKQYGILNLVQYYSRHDCELYQFLANRNISFDLTNKLLIYNTQSFDISPNTDNSQCYRIGNKFFYDYGVNGFLSMGSNPYGGNVHQRPELLLDIDRFLGTKLSDEWAETHTAYEITVTVPGEKVITVDNDPEDIFVDYIINAYHNAFYSLSAKQIHIKREQSVEASEIKSIQKLQHWL